MRQRTGLAIAIISLPLFISSCDAAGELGANWNGLIGQLLSFGILFLVLTLFAYKPITRMLEERSKRIQDSMDQAEFIKQETARTEQMVHEQLAEARKQGMDIVAQAEQVGDRLKEEARVQARKDAEAIASKAQAEIRAESQEAIAQLRKEFIGVAIMAAERVIDKALDKEAHRQIIEKTLEESTALKKEG
ncbi:MAG: F0F1 ATP synthase subunit B [Dehalococcoidia bacterium]